MYILKTEEKGPDTLIYWTIDGEHIFRIQTLPNTNKGDNKHEPASEPGIRYFG
jgi:hypothetical protein